MRRCGLVPLTGVDGRNGVAATLSSDRDITPRKPSDVARMAGSIPAGAHMAITTYLIFVAVLAAATAYLVWREEE